MAHTYSRHFGARKPLFFKTSVIVGEMKKISVRMINVGIDFQVFCITLIAAFMINQVLNSLDILKTSSLNQLILNDDIPASFLTQRVWKKAKWTTNLF